MIPTLAQDLKVIMGRLGAWPADFGPEVCVNLAAVASQHLTPGGIALDVTPGSGRATVLVAAAAYRVGARVVTMQMGAEAPVEELWFNRAMRMFKLNEVVTRGGKIGDDFVVLPNGDKPGAFADFVVVRNDAAIAARVFAGMLKPEGLLFGVNLPQIGDIAPEQSGNGWAVWRRPKTPELKLVKGAADLRAPEDGAKQLDMRSFLPPDDPEYDEGGADGVRADG